MRKILGCLVLAGAVSGAAVASDDKWIHVRVDDTDGGTGRVDIQVPVGMAASLLPMLKGRPARGSIQVDDASFDLAELRGYWTALRAAEDGEYVKVRDEDSDVRISKRGGSFLLNVDDRGGRSRVRMKLSLPIIDAVFSGGDSPDLCALAEALASAPAGELLTVHDEDSHVRIWIDGVAAPAREDAP